MKTQPRHLARTDGSAVIVVLVLLFLMTVLLSVNSMSLRCMQRSLQSIEHREMKKFAPAPTKAR